MDFNDILKDDLLVFTGSYTQCYYITDITKNKIYYISITILKSLNEIYVEKGEMNEYFWNTGVDKMKYSMPKNKNYIFKEIFKIG